MSTGLLLSTLLVFSDISRLYDVREKMHDSIVECNNSVAIVYICIKLKDYFHYSACDLHNLYKLKGVCELRLMKYTDSETSYAIAERYGMNNPTVDKKSILDCKLNIVLCNIMQGDFKRGLKSLERDKNLMSVMEDDSDCISQQVDYYLLLIKCKSGLNDNKAVSEITQKILMSSEKIKSMCPKGYVKLVSDAIYYNYDSDNIVGIINQETMRNVLRASSKEYGETSSVTARAIISNCLLLSLTGNPSQRLLCADYLEKLVKICRGSKYMHHELFDTYSRCIYTLLFIYKIDGQNDKYDLLYEGHVKYCKERIGEHSHLYKLAITKPR